MRPVLEGGGLVTSRRRYEEEGQGDPRAWSSPVPRRPHPGWCTVGLVLGLTIAILGLAALAGAVLFVVGLSNIGSNK